MQTCNLKTDSKMKHFTFDLKGINQMNPVADLSVLGGFMHSYNKNYTV